MQDRKGKPTDRADPHESAATAERRRIAKVVRDDRGNASVEWVRAPDDHERPTLSVEESDPAKKPEGGYNPYERIPKVPRDPLYHGKPEQRSGRRDLRRLSEWIKQMRDLEQRKRRSDED